jgi:hypothetical protein
MKDKVDVLNPKDLLTISTVSVIAMVDYFFKVELLHFLDYNFLVLLELQSLEYSENLLFSINKTLAVQNVMEHYNKNSALINDRK